MKKADILTANEQVKAAKIGFAELGPPKKIILDVCMNFMSYMFKQCHIQMNIEQSITLSYHHQSNGQLGACIKFVKCTIQKCFDNNNVNLPLLQIRSMSIGVRIPHPATLLFNIPIRSLLPQITRVPINIINNGAYYEALKVHQKYIKYNDTCIDSCSSFAGSTVAIQCKNGRP